MKDQQAIEDVLNHYLELIRRTPNDLEIVTNLAWAHERAGQYDQALEQFKRALELAPQDHNVHYGLGLALLGNGNTKDAVTELTLARDLAVENLERSAAVIISRQIQAITDRLQS